jgi:hypothetical protein
MSMPRNLKATCGPVFAAIKRYLRRVVDLCGRAECVDAGDES